VRFHVQLNNEGWPRVVGQVIRECKDPILAVPRASGGHRSGTAPGVRSERRVQGGAVCGAAAASGQRMVQSGEPSQRGPLVAGVVSDLRLDLGFGLARRTDDGEEPPGGAIFLPRRFLGGLKVGDQLALRLEVRSASVVGSQTPRAVDVWPLPREGG